MYEIYYYDVNGSLEFGTCASEADLKAKIAKYVEARYTIRVYTINGDLVYENYIC